MMFFFLERKKEKGNGREMKEKKGMEWVGGWVGVWGGEVCKYKYYYFFLII
jgi:hypothetical protein